MPKLPGKARVVVIGGGVVGCSVVYHLAKRGWTDVVLLERKQLTSGTTWHAAGLIAQLRSTLNMTRLAKYSGELYERLEAETGIATGFSRTGSLAVALTGERLEEFQRSASMAKTHDIEMEIISPSECKLAYPLLDLHGIVGGLWTPGDGQADPTNVALALARGARQNGVQIFENVKVIGISRTVGRVTGVLTADGSIEAEIVVNCAGMWARDVGRLAGVNVPLQACEHFYIVTESIPELTRHMPTLRVPDESAYYKEDAGKILLGAFESKAKPWAVDGIPDSFCFDQLPEDFEHFAPILETAIKRVPVLERVGIRTFFNGPESFTPDDRYLLGEAPELRNFYVAAGFNSVGIQSAGGAGRALADWIVDDEAPFDLWDVDIRRMHPFQGTKTYIAARVSETLGLLYADHFPYRQYSTARGVRHTPFHEQMAARGAYFGETAGWERPNWFLPQAELERGQKPENIYSWKRQNWFAYSAAEHRSVREAAGIFDLSAFGKFRVEGPDAETALQLICANNVAVGVGVIIYTQWLNPRGGIEADVTITRLSETSFLIVTSAACVTRDVAWLRRHLPAEARCIVTDVTSGEAVLGIMGPRSRDVLERLTSADLSNRAFPFRTAQEIDIGMTWVRAHRITGVGELGWELYIPTEFARHVLQRVLEVATTAEARLCGMHTFESCRVEKAYRHFGHDISSEDHVLEAGLGFGVKLDKPRSRFGDFLGREGVLRKRQAGCSKRLVQFKLRDPEPLLYHNEPILRDGQVAGYITSGAYGHHLGGAVGLGYVAHSIGEAAAALMASDYEIEIAGSRVGATVSLEPFYDPRNHRVRI
ncbi:FAD-dependent oxidoreductase [Acidiphilium sp. AL]|uniref:GcvT family protein n=1 Tax=Acidiphilium sp. AL TaxID=2871704 RepID=UPI0021CB2AE8|nr:FAD-dependent oxidoreductase [Acidiphilium sp. AL]MCU4162033.1 FAD-dependent oxidoreductase [Acidiphilium sp. AL]